MGVGKTIQAIASMSAFSDDWPLLVICPSGLITNWKNEFLRWLGRNSGSKKDKGKLILNDYNIKMLTKESDSAQLPPNSKRFVFIVSFELATKLVKWEKLCGGMFKAVIIDESHMLSTEKSQKTIACSTIANAAKRLVIISGSPALSSPSQLNPQISLLVGNGNDTEGSALTKYTGRKWKVHDLNSLLEATEFTIVLKILMIRRLKGDVMKSLPPKERVIVPCDIKNNEIIAQTQRFLEESEGNLARILREQNVVERNEGDGEADGEACVRRVNMFSLLQKTGLAKVGYVGDALKKFIDDEKGKVCVFARHKLVLNRLEEIGE
jgi:SWI/SNF-related matrix-associated actin-dependent regulator 1 of chromatin subfamily A